MVFEVRTVVILCYDYMCRGHWGWRGHKGIFVGASNVFF